MKTLKLITPQAKYAVRNKDDYLITELEGGFSRTRLNFVKNTKEVNVSWNLNGQQYDYLQGFIKSVDNGADWFLLNLIVGIKVAELHTVKFIDGSIKLSSFTGIKYIVDARLEVKTIDNTVYLQSALDHFYDVAPLVSYPIEVVVKETENYNWITVDLLQYAIDPEGGTLRVIDLVVTNDPNSAIELGSGNRVTVTTNAYDLADDDNLQVIRLAYNVGNDGAETTPQRATITIRPSLAPIVTQVIDKTFTQDDGYVVVDLLEYASDPEGGTLSSASYIVTGDFNNIVDYIPNASRVIVHTDVEGDLNAGENRIITLTYVVKNNGSWVSQTATITVTGANGSPVPIDHNWDDGIDWDDTEDWTD